MFGLDIKGSARNVPEEIEKDIDNLSRKFAANIVAAIPEVMRSGTRTGKLYRRGRFRRGQSRGLRGVRARGAGNRIHRASAPGEPLASDTGRTERSISIRQMRKGVIRIRVGGGVAFWELRGAGARPTVLPAIELAAQRTFA